MKTSESKQRIQNYFLVKEALLRRFPEKAVYYDDLSHSTYLTTRYFFPYHSKFIVIYYDGYKLFYPYALDLISDPEKPNNKIISALDKNNVPTNLFTDYIYNFSPTPDSIDKVCNKIKHEFTKLKEKVFPRTSMTESDKLIYYHIVKKALYKHFPKDAIVDYPFQHSVYLSSVYFFKDAGQTALIYYAQDRLLYPHHLDYLNVPNSNYTSIVCMDKDNKPITKYNDYLTNLSPTTKDIEDICKRMKEYIKLNKIKEDF